MHGQFTTVQLVFGLLLSIRLLTNISQASAGRTTITIAHRLSTIRNADRIIVFDHGKIIETGTHLELMELAGTYLELVRAQEIEKVKREERIAQKDFDEGVARSTEIERFSRSASSASSELVRASKRMKRSLTNASAQDQAIAELKDECEEIKAEPSGLLEIIRFANKEWMLLIFALIGSLAKGVVFPIFSIIYGSMFKSLSKPNDDDKLEGARTNAIYFAILGICSGISTFIGGFLFSAAGESLTRRLRLSLFSHIMKQDGEYFDSLEHSSGKLTTRLATDAPNIRAAIDQRLSDVVQCVSGLISGIIIAFSYGPKMAPIGIVTAVALITIQTITAQYLKIRTTRDQKLAEEPSRAVYNPAVSLSLLAYHAGKVGTGLLKWSEHWRVVPSQERSDILTLHNFEFYCNAAHNALVIHKN